MSAATETVAHVVADGSGDPEHVDDCTSCAPAKGFYVTVRHAKRSGALLGPYATHGEALANVDRAKRYVLEYVDFASFYAYGTAKATAKPGRELPTGRLNDRVGLTAD